MFRWIQISDLHFSNSSNYQTNILKTKLLDVIEKNKNANGVYNALFLTGDYRFAKNDKGNPNKIVKYIKDIVSKAGIDNNSIYCVPGNHDLDRSPIRTALIASSQKYDENTGVFEETILKHLKSDFSFFAEIEKELCHTNSNFPKCIKIKDCNIVLLNTAITAGKDDERGTLIIGKNDINKVLGDTDKNKPTIVLGHHGMSFWDREEAKEIGNIFFDHKVGLYLCGHEHSLWKETVGQGTVQITSGCINNNGEKAELGFSTGEIDDKNEVTIKFYIWNSNHSNWLVTPEDSWARFTMPTSQQNNNIENNDLMSEVINIPNDYNDIPIKKYNFQLDGHSLIGPRGSEGIKYYWKKGEDAVESLAFNRRVNEQSNSDPVTIETDKNTSAYTISVSCGCALSIMQKQCRFCATGSRNFKGFLTAEEIAMQSIFMMYYDMNCTSYPEVRNHQREISFMGQGEPGYSYPFIREAIKIIDCAAEIMHQKISRYVISTCGISDFMPSLIDDISNNVFKNNVNIHFSLHSIDEQRNRIMPINIDYDYKEFIQQCNCLYNVTNEKIGVGILMFKNFAPSKRVGEEDTLITLDERTLKSILKTLDSKVFRIDLCDFNKTPVATRENNMEVSNEDARKFKKLAEKMGFVTKTFSSFGTDRESGCGMLRSEYIDAEPDGKRTLENYEKSLEILHYASNKVKNCK